jgi:hypothetical protein
MDLVTTVQDQFRKDLDNVAQLLLVSMLKTDAPIYATGPTH